MAQTQAFVSRHSVRSTHYKSPNYKTKWPALHRSCTKMLCLTRESSFLNLSVALTSKRDAGMEHRVLKRMYSTWEPSSLWPAWMEAWRTFVSRGPQKLQKEIVIFPLVHGPPAAGPRPGSGIPSGLTTQGGHTHHFPWKILQGIDLNWEHQRASHWRRNKHAVPILFYGLI